MKNYHKENESPKAITKYDWCYHHLGIPTTMPQPDEKYKMYVSGFESSEIGIEWMRFEDDSPISKLIQSIPHFAFGVDNLDAAVDGKELIGAISSPAPGIHVAMIIENGAPIELLQFIK
jgi:hypothetical protein